MDSRMGCVAKGLPKILERPWKLNSDVPWVGRKAQTAAMAEGTQCWRELQCMASKARCARCHHSIRWKSSELAAEHLCASFAREQDRSVRCPRLYACVDCRAQELVPEYHPAPAFSMYDGSQGQCGDVASNAPEGRIGNLVLDPRDCVDRRSGKYMAHRNG